MERGSASRFHSRGVTREESSAPEITARALLVGGGIGVVLAAGNVYAGLKTGYIDGGSVTAALVGSALLGLAGRGAASAREVNLTQTVASSAAVMSFAAGVCAPIPALALAGHAVSGGLVLAWGLALGVLGIALAWRLRGRLIETEQLPFPTGQATAEVIAALGAGAGARRGRLLSLGLAAAAAGAIVWLRDRDPHWVPQAWLPGFTVAGVAAGALTLGLAASPLMLSTGVLVGVRGAASMAGGAVVAWGVLGPLAVERGHAAEASYPALVPILLWPGLALLLASALTQLAFAWPTMRRSLRDLRGALGGAAGAGEGAGRLLPVAAVAALVTVMVAGVAGFGLSPLVLLGLLPIAFALSAAAARAAGETDQAPVGQVGALAQLGLGRAGLPTSLAGGGLVAGIATQTAQTLWAFKAGHRLGASPRAQVKAQLLGAVIGAVVVVPVYGLVRAAYPLGSEAMPAPSAMAWRATAEAALGAAPLAAPLVWQSTAAAGILGVALTLLERRRWRWLPSATALGAAFVLPASLSMAMLLGALAFAAVARARPAWAEAHGPSLAAGGIAGESLVGLAVAALDVWRGG